MSTYAIGDVQGCYDELEALLQLIRFDDQKDQLWFAGDLVSRGPKSLETIRFVRKLNLSQNAMIVLGNHDLHLLAVGYGPDLPQIVQRKKAFLDILEAEDKGTLLDWLRQQPFLRADQRLGYVMTHAGIFPGWTLEEAQSYAKELEFIFHRDKLKDFFSHIYSDLPDQWNEQLTGWERLRFITNVFTRMRFCTREGKLDFQFAGPPGSQPQTLIPWFTLSNRFEPNMKILFGHWAALKGETSQPGFFALDGGCVWGGHLIAMRLEDQRVFKVYRLS